MEKVSAEKYLINVAWYYDFPRHVAQRQPFGKKERRMYLWQVLSFRTERRIYYEKLQFMSDGEEASNKI